MSQSESEAAGTDAAVRAQYEEFPYPARVPEDERTNLIVRTFARLDSVSHHCYGGRQDFRRFRVLAAGGGAGDSTIFWGEQLRGRGASEVVYLDLSSASMSIAQRRAEIRQLDNVHWVNDSLLNLPRLGLGQFDFVDCTGVLHHLEDPQAGLDALVSVLAPGGAMNLALYALYGRTGVYQVQALMRLVNAPEEGSSRRVANTRTMIENLPPYHWVNLAKSAGFTLGDLSNDAGVFDMFLHPRDRAYTIMQVHELLDGSGLELAGEPGTYYGQRQYLPETFVKDPELRERIAHYPLRRRQAIAEVMSGRLSMHELYAVRAGEGGRGARVTDTALVPWEGMDRGRAARAPRRLRRTAGGRLRYHAPRRSRQAVGNPENQVDSVLPAADRRAAQHRGALRSREGGRPRRERRRAHACLRRLLHESKPRSRPIPAPSGQPCVPTAQRNARALGGVTTKWRK